MATKLIISYDGTNNEEDALALGRLFAAAGSQVALAYVRHSIEHERELSADIPQAQAEQLLAKGAELYGDPGVERHVVDDRSTPAGLLALSGQISAQGVVFCSDSHTALGRVSIGNSARWLLEGGPLAVAIAPAGLYDHAPKRLEQVACFGAEPDPAAVATAQALAAASGAAVVPRCEGPSALVIFSSRPEARPGTVAPSAAAEAALEESRAAVLVLPRAVSLFT